MSETAIVLQGLTRRFGSGATAVSALENLNLSIEAGTVTALLGE